MLAFLSNDEFKLKEKNDVQELDGQSRFDCGNGRALALGYDFFPGSSAHDCAGTYTTLDRGCRAGGAKEVNSRDGTCAHKSVQSTVVDSA